MQGHKTHLTSWLIGCSWLCAAAGCGEADNPQVDYGDTQPVGRWAVEADSAKTSASKTEKEEEEEVEDGAANAAPQPSAASKTTSAMGSSSTTASAGTAAAQPQAPSGMAATGAAGSGRVSMSGTATKPSSGSNAGGMGGSAGMGGSSVSTAPTGGSDTTAPVEETGMSSVSSLEFSVTTQPVGGRYQPKNIGAIWITDGSGKFVKSLEVWARTRKRWLTKYNAAHGTGAADVTATATLTSHKAHMATWDLKDASGAAVAPGKYKLFAEVTDADATGKSVSVDFDLSAGPSSATPPDTAGFTKMTLDLK